jgi:heparin binding hemagglutinin HbhA
MAKAKFDIKTEATKSLHAGVGAADLAVETVKVYAKDAQKRLEGVQKDAVKALEDAQKSVKGFEFKPKALRSQATTVVTARVDELSKEAVARRDLIEKRVAALQADAQKFVSTNVETATDTYETLAKRGETVVKKIRKDTAKTVAPEGNVVKQAPARKPAAKKAPAKKTTAKKTAKKAPAKTAS